MTPTTMEVNAMLVDMDLEYSDERPFEEVFEEKRNLWDTVPIRVLSARQGCFELAFLDYAFPARSASLPESDLYEKYEILSSSVRRTTDEETDEKDPMVPMTRDGREFVERCMREGLLQRRNRDMRGEYTWTLTSDAMQAMECLDMMQENSVRFAGERMETVRLSLESLAAQVAGDISERRRILEGRFEKARSELDEFERRVSIGEDVDVIGHDEAVAQCRNIIALMRSLPSDFNRLAGELRSLVVQMNVLYDEGQMPAGDLIKWCNAETSSMLYDSDYGKSIVSWNSENARGDDAPGSIGWLFQRIIGSDILSGDGSLETRQDMTRAKREISGANAMLTDERNRTTRAAERIAKGALRKRTRGLGVMIDKMRKLSERLARENPRGYLEQVLPSSSASICKKVADQIDEKLPSPPPKAPDVVAPDVIGTEEMRRYRFLGGKPRTDVTLPKMREAGLLSGDEVATFFEMLEHDERRMVDIADMYGRAARGRDFVVVEDAPRSAWHVAEPDGGESIWRFPRLELR